MNIAIIYLFVAGKSDPSAPPPEHYYGWSERFMQSYRKYKGDVLHNLHIISCGDDIGKHRRVLFHDCNNFHTYKGHGWDVGAHQYALSIINTDFAICMATPTYFWREGFIQSIVSARLRYGDGLYGPTASYENSPHIRTCCWACDPKTIRKYPIVVDNREKTFYAESSHESITNWYLKQKMPVYLVAPSGCYVVNEWRTPNNIFRRGDQSNCYIKDRHTDWYDVADINLKTEFERRSNAKTR